jgi:CheY-like chemotaxis protein
MKTIKNPHAIDIDKSMIIEFMTQQLRTSLNTILGFSDLLNRKSLTESSKKSYNEYVYHSSLSLLLLYNNLLDLIELGKENCIVTSESCHLPKFMEDLQKKYKNELDKRDQQGIRLKMVVPDQPGYSHILTDEKKLRRVMENLIENALGFAHEGTIEFGYTVESGEMLKFYVKDQGVGFSLVKLEELFQLFISKNKTLDVSFDLASIRAVVAKQFAGLLGGNLQSESVLTQGSTFYFSLALEEREKAGSKDLHDRSIELIDWSDRSILIAEDVETNFRLLEELLSPTRVKLTWAKNGKEAVELFSESGEFDAILMDIIMPEMDGFEAADKIRKISRSVPIIAQTAFTPDEDDTDSQVRNFNEFLIKPIWWHDLANSLSKYLD